MKEKSMMKWVFVVVVLIIAVMAGVAIRDFAFNHDPVQEARVVVADLNGTIEKFNQIELPGRFRPTENLPFGLLKKVQETGKDDIQIGMVLRGRCNFIFCAKKTQEYLNKHPRHILWKEKMDEGVEDVWIFLEQKDRPDPEFLRIVD